MDMQTKNRSLTVICNQLVWKPGLTSCLPPSSTLGVALKRLRRRFSHSRQQTRVGIAVFLEVLCLWTNLNAVHIIILGVLQIKMKLPARGSLCCCAWGGQCPTRAEVCCLPALQRHTVINILEPNQHERRSEMERGKCGCFCHAGSLSVETFRYAAAAASLRGLGSSTSGSLKITRANNKQTEAITGRESRAIRLGQGGQDSRWSLSWWAAALQREQRYLSLLTDPCMAAACCLQQPHMEITLTFVCVCVCAH